MTNTGTTAHTMITSKLGVHVETITVTSVRAARQAFTEMKHHGDADQAAVYGPGTSVQPVAYFE